MLDAIDLHSIGEFLLVLHKFDLHVHLAASLLNFAQKEQVFDERKDAGRGVFFGNRKRLWVGNWIRCGKTRPSRSATAVAVFTAHIGAVAVVHGGGVNPLLFLTRAAHWAAGATFRRTPSTAPFMSSSACGGMSGSCIHIFSLVKLKKQIEN